MRLCAENVTGLKRAAEATGVPRFVEGRGRGAFSTGGSWTARTGGLLRSEHVDISNEKMGEKPIRRKPKVSWARVILLGLVGS